MPKTFEVLSFSDFHVTFTSKVCAVILCGPYNSSYEALLKYHPDWSCTNFSSLRKIRGNLICFSLQSFSIYHWIDSVLIPCCFAYQVGVTNAVSRLLRLFGLGSSVPVPFCFRLFCLRIHCSSTKWLPTKVFLTFRQRIYSDYSLAVLWYSSRSIWKNHSRLRQFFFIF